MATRRKPLFSDNDGVAPDTGILTDKMTFVEVDKEDPEDDPDTEPIEHNDIRNTPVELPTVLKGKGRTPSLQKELESWYMMIGTGVFPFDPQVATVILSQAPQCAEALNDLAMKNPRVKRALQSMLTAGAYGAVITAHLPIAVILATKYTPLGEQYGAFLSQAMGAEKPAA